MLTAMMLFSSCSYRMVDFSIISSKNHSLDIDKSKGIRVEGKSLGFLDVGASIKDAMDEALQSAGSEYDILIDGVVRRLDFFFVSGYKVSGIALKSSELQAYLGEDGYRQWCKENNVFDPIEAVAEN